MSAYKAMDPQPLTLAQAQEMGQWLRKYQIDIAGLSVYQITDKGTRVRDDPLADTIKTTIGQLGGAAVLAAPLAPLLGPLAVAAAPFAWLALGPTKAAEHQARKQAGPQIPRGEQVTGTEIEFNLVGVSAKRRKWTEYLLAIYAAHHGWQLTGLQHPEQVAVGAAYAARTGGYPPAWSEQPARPKTPAGKRPAGKPAKGKPARPGGNAARPSVWRGIAEKLTKL